MGHMRGLLRVKLWARRLVPLSRDENNSFPRPPQGPKQAPDFVYFAKDNIAMCVVPIFERERVGPKGARAIFFETTSGQHGFVWV